MSDNSKLVNYFVKLYLENNSIKMAAFVSLDFSYYLNFGERKNFEQFIERMHLLTSATSLAVSEIVSGDDIHFNYDFEVILPAPNEGVKALGFAQFTVQKKLIHRIDINYQKNENEFEEFQGLIKNSSTVFL